MDSRHLLRLDAEKVTKRWLLFLRGPKIGLLNHRESGEVLEALQSRR